MPRIPFAFPLLAALAVHAPAQDVVTLHSVTFLANGNVTVVYSKNFATCAHLRSSNPSCTQNGPLVHVANLFCTSGNQVTVTLPTSSFTAGFGPGQPVYLVHGNNSSVRSPCVTVGCNGAYGVGCAGAAGVPVLAASSDCPAAGSTLNLGVSGAVPAGVGVMGFGIGQASAPVLGCQLLLGSVIGTTAMFFDAAGAAAVPFPLPAGSGGVQFTVQAFTIDAGGPQGFGATAARLIRVL